MILEIGAAWAFMTNAKKKKDPKYWDEKTKKLEALNAAKDKFKAVSEPKKAK